MILPPSGGISLISTKGELLKMAEKLVKIYLIGDRYLPELNHPRFGKFQLEDEGCFQVPRVYADRLLMNSPKVFSLKASKKKEGAFTGAEYSNMSYKELQDYAKSREVPKYIGVPKADIVRTLINMDKEAEKPKEPEKPKKEKPVVEQV
jgi:hypothetical protein